jgi:exosortase
LWIAIAALAIAVGWFAAPTLVHFARIWRHEPDYSHGFLVPAASGYLLWRRREYARGLTLRPNAWGLVGIGLALAMHAAGNHFARPWLAQLFIVPLALGCIVLVGGRTLYRWAWPSALFLAFMAPLPASLETGLRGPLRRIATQASVYTLQTLGLPAHAEGDVIALGAERIGVADACSGLSMLVMFVAIAVAAAIIVKRRSPWDKLLVLVSAIPIAIACNVARLTATAILYASVGHRIGDWLPVGGWLGAVDFHDLLGFLMLPLAVGLTWVLLRILSWVLLVPRPIAIRPRRTAAARPRATG